MNDGGKLGDEQKISRFLAFWTIAFMKTPADDIKLPTTASLQESSSGFILVQSRTKGL